MPSGRADIILNLHISFHRQSVQLAKLDNVVELVNYFELQIALFPINQQTSMKTEFAITRNCVCVNSYTSKRKPLLAVDIDSVQLKKIACFSYL